MRDRLRGDEGFTLIELLVVMLIMGLVGGFTVQALVQGYRTSSDVQARLDTQAELQNVQITVTRRLRGACPVIAVGASDTTVQVRHSNGDVERFRFHLPSGGVLFEDRDRWNGTAWVDVSNRPIADGLDNLTAGVPVFTALDDEGLPTTNTLDVWAFRTQLLRSVPDGDDVLVTTTASLRNGDSPCPTAP